MIIKTTLPLLLLTVFLWLKLPAQDHQFDWAFLINAPSSSSNLVDKCVTDHEGNILVIGRFTDTTTFGTGSNAQQLITRNAGRNEIFMAKYNKYSELIWIKRFEQLENIATATGIGFDIVTDNSGDVYASGFFSGTVDFDPGTGTHTYKAQTGLGSGFDVFTVKLDKDGDFKWANRITKNQVEFSGYMFSALTHGMALSICNSSGDLLLGAYSTRSSTLGGDTLYFGNNISVTSTGIHLGKLNSQNGEFIWVKTLDDLGTGQGNCNAITNDQYGNIYITGGFRDSIDFDPGSNMEVLKAIPRTYSANSRNMFLAKYDSSGAMIWAKNFEANYYGSGSAIVLDDSANIHIAGIFLDSMDFNPDPNNSYILRGPTVMPRYNTFVTKLDSGGNFIWAGQFVGERAGSVRDIALDAFGNVYTIGGFSGNVDFDPGSGTENRQAPSINATHVFISKLTAEGTYAWVRTFGPSTTSGVANGYAIAIDKSNNLFAGGALNRANDVDFNAGYTPVHLLSAIGSQQGFLLKLTCADTFHTPMAETVCNVYTLNGKVYTESGIYTQKYWSAGGCDSIITLDLTVNHIEKPNINVNNFILGVTGNYYTYQWLKDSVLLPGETNSTLTVTENANYQVIVTTEEGCSDTSDVYPVSNVSISEIERIAGQVIVAPNPTLDIVSINAPVTVNVSLAGIDGKIIRQVNNAQGLSLQNLSQGIYFLNIYDDANRLIKVEKVVKQ